MIVFDLKCGKDHVFEAWFPDTSGFERQRADGKVVCPVCGDTGCEKALMAPNIAVSRGKDEGREKAIMAEAWQKLNQLRAQVEEKCEYVGPRFAEEARKIHYGETDHRDIYGEATADEAKSLKDEGVEFGLIPWLPRAEN